MERNLNFPDLDFAYLDRHFFPRPITYNARGSALPPFLNILRNIFREGNLPWDIFLYSYYALVDECFSLENTKHLPYFHI